jgi:hypothetical protein
MHVSIDHNDRAEMYTVVIRLHVQALAHADMAK